MTFRFGEPWLLLLLALAPLVLAWRPRRGGAAFPAFPLVGALPRSRGPIAWRALMAAGLALLAVAAARPQYGRSVVEREHAGRDLVLVIDTSLSMAVDDLTDAEGQRSDRLAAVFSAAKDFVRRRPGDRLGLVFFASNAVTSCPLTYDHDTVVEFIDRTEEQQRWRWDHVGRRNGEAGFVGDGTNIGLGVGYALKGLTGAESRGRAIVLITDGADSKELRNWVDPLAAARHCGTEGIRIWGIGVGNPNGSHTRRDMFGRTVSVPMPAHLLPDLPRLESIASLSGGIAFPANDRQALDRVLRRIDELEPTSRSLRTREDFADRFLLPLALGCALCGLALLLQPRLLGVA